MNKDSLVKSRGEVFKMLDKDALAEMPYGKTDIIEQTVNYYFQTIERR